MTDRFSDVYSAPNLFKNGGFETGDLDFWSLTTSVAGPVLAEEVESSEACRRYVHFLLSQESPFYVEQSFDSNIGGVTDVSPHNRYDLGFASTNALTSVSDDSIRGCDLTSSLSIKVVGGNVNVYGIFGVKSSLDAPAEGGGVDYNTLMFPYSHNFSSRTWSRLTGNILSDDYEDGFIYSAGFKIERASGSPQIFIGNFQLIEGAYEYLPYTGCLFSKVMPKGLLVLSMGVTCPPGFEEVSSENYFIYSGNPEDGAGGSDRHQHAYDQRMRDGVGDEDNDAYQKREIFNDISMIKDRKNKTESSLVLIDDARQAHTHEIVSPGGSSNSIPNNRKYLLCRKK